jgi:hypothetical protein
MYFFFFSLSNFHIPLPDVFADLGGGGVLVPQAEYHWYTQRYPVSTAITISVLYAVLYFM